MREVIIKVSDKDFETYYRNDTKVQELVRCKDCIYHDQDFPHQKRCRILDTWTEAEEFCSWGMRWQDGTDGSV